MRGRTVFLNEGSELLLTPRGEPDRPVEVVVPYNNPPLAAQALSAALKLAHGFEAVVTLLCIHVLPYPSPLEVQEGIRRKLETELTTVARTSPAPIQVRLVFARNREAAYLALLQQRSLVVVGAKDRWWRTREERMARKLAAGGHSVAIVRVK